VLTVAAIAAACGGGGDEEPTTTTSSTTTSSSTTTTTGAAASTTTTVPAVPTCATSQLAAAISEPDAGAGQRNAYVTFTNNGGAPCTMFGYVGLQLLDSSGDDIPTDVVRGPGPNDLVTLNPGGQASTTLQWSAIASGNEPDDGPCEANPAQIEITSPNATSSLTQPWNNGPVCGQGEINTVPIVAGAPPQQ
jgi:Protein of unknown function (DUF4232)